ncbi:MAG: hypothetical protein LBP51_03190 [Deferribacteraceae bacterium]|jgi:hypothetical protein|nr:hypothetical protein [Deferribacteraceae bacterium]
MFQVKGIFRSLYFRLVVIMSLCYILTQAFALDSFDYIIVLYLLHIRLVSEENSIPIAFTFGLFYDLAFPIFLGAGVLLFMGLNFLKIYIFQLFDMSKLYSHFIFAIGVLAAYLLVTLRLFNFPQASFLMGFAYYFTINFAVSLVVLLIFGRRYAVSAA